MSQARATDWDAYYSRPFPAAHVTRNYTIAAVRRHLRRLDLPNNPHIVELGGADSCVYSDIRRHFRPSRYHVVDNNGTGLDRLRQRIVSEQLVLEQADLLHWRPRPEADLSLSLGLIEHFDVAGTARIVAAHLDCLHPGGHAVIFFPTPTWLYRLVRGVAERLDQWAFHDERPLRLPEVREALGDRAELVDTAMHWPPILTQRSVVARKA
ncbi:MAG: class I SAM-dependent methyltransferase [Alphaproteobacteria bacterium]